MSAFIVKVLLFALWSLVDGATFYFIGYRQAKRGLPAVVVPRI